MQTLSGTMILVLGVLALWELFWKAKGLWRAAKQDNKTWFLVILIINSIGILPIIYILMTNPKKG